MRVDVAVIGAGIQGSSVALRLAQAGAKVAVLERGIPGAEASSAAAGILSPGVEAVEPGPFHALCRASLERYPSFVRELEALSGMSVGFRALGTLEVALDETHAKVLAGRAEKMLRHGLPVEVLDDSAVRRLEPTISPSARGALFFPDEASVDPPCWLQIPSTREASGAPLVTRHAGSRDGGHRVRELRGPTPLSREVLESAAGARGLGADALRCKSGRTR
jgi:glycine/D-amino acid oxidase-like deaminating enzyme